MSKTKITHQQFFVIRTPRMPLANLAALGTDINQTRQALNHWISQPQVKEALYLASPSLLERLERTSPSSNKSRIKQQKKLEQALLKYMIRMCSRPTPFGLFSGIHKGQIGDKTQIVSQDLSQDKRKTRLDMFYLSALKTHFLSDNARSEQLKYYPNSSHYFVAEHCRYIEAYQSDQTRQYRLSAVEVDEYFSFLLAQAKQGLSFEQLISAFVDHYPQAQSDEVAAYVQALIDESVLIADIPLPLTGTSPDNALVQSLANIGETDTAEDLAQVLSQLNQLDQKQGAEISDYKDILTRLSKLPTKVTENKLFQSDVYRAFEHCQLEQNQLNKLVKQLKLLKGVGSEPIDEFSEFIRRFNLRYEGQFVPLDILLDEESGIGFSNESAYEAPLLAGLPMGREGQANLQTKVASKLDLIITETISKPKNRGAAVITLTSKQLDEALTKPVDDNRLPASFAAMVSLYQTEQGQPLLKFVGCFGPSAANLLGRFCHLDEALKQQVIDHLDNESHHSADVIFAEIVHMPEGRPGNVIARPHLRKYEIVFLADSSLADEYQIPISDLHVWVEGDKVKLWSKRLNKQIIPRLSSAHNYSARSLGAYKFLSMLHKQYGTATGFSLPESQAGACFVPRIMLDNLILSNKLWRIPRKDLAAILQNDQIDDNKWQSLQQEYQLDEHVSYAVSDNVLQLNLTNPLMLEILLAETKSQTKIELTEVLSAQYDSPVKSSEGENYANELIIPFFNPGATPYSHFHDDPQANILAAPIKRRFTPGSPWLSIKIYSGNTTGDQLLSTQLWPLIEQCDDYYQKWFFIRYGDPEPHLRLRFYGEPQRLLAQLLPRLNQLLDPMVENGQLHKVELFTYEREVERYGGPDAMAMVESLFMADSALVAKTGLLEHQSEQDIRWRITMLMTDQLLDAFNLDPAHKLDLISVLRAGFGREFSDTNPLRKQLGNKFKDRQAQLTADLDGYSSSTTVTTNELDIQLLDLVKQWYQQAKPTITSLNQLIDSEQGIKCSKDNLLSSILHMHNNRMFKAYGRKHELVMHDFMRRYYFSLNKGKSG